MTSLPHRIRRLRCLVSTSDQVEAFAIRQSLRDRWQDTLLPVFEHAFDEISSSDRVIYIPKIELHVKVTSNRELIEVLPELIQQQLHEKLQAIDVEISSNQQGFSTREATVPQTQFAILLHYLQTGSVLWQTAHAAVSEIGAGLKETCVKERSQLVNHLNNQPESVAFYFRLLQLLSASNSITIIGTLSDQFPLESRTVITELIRFVLTEPSRLTRHTQWQIVATILSESLKRSQQPRKPGISKILADTLTQSGIEPSTFFAELPEIAAVLFQPQSPTISNPSESQNSEISADSAAMYWNASQRESLLNLDTAHLLEPSGDMPSPETELPDPVRILTVETASSESEFPFLVNYAGLVLIHPFISPFFEATGVKEANSQVISDAHIPKAAALLHFLATGQKEIYEYELRLIKILLGLEPDTPILVGAGLVEECDREEAESLLQSAINYWTVLKGTSVHGLRSSFLRRSGLMRKTENGWNLQVEHQSFDLLLEHLPWSISIVKLSWMKYPLYTEWQSF